MLETLTFYLSYPFVRYALIVGTLIALCSSLLGVTLVSRRMSFIGDSLSHVAFSIAAVSGVLNMAGKLPLTMIGTVLFTIFLLNNKKGTGRKDDSVLAMISVASLALGYIVMNLFATSSNVSADVCTTLFGSTSILTLTKANVLLCVIMSVIVIALFVLFYNYIFSTTFDEDFARTSGVNVNLINMVFSVMVAVIIVLAMNLVGSLLITALIIFPALSAMKLQTSFQKVTILSTILSVICSIGGIITSILASTPVGSTIVMIDFIVFLIASLVGRLRKAV